MASFFFFFLGRNYNPLLFCILNLIAILVFASLLSPFNLCDAGSPLEIFKLRRGVKLSFYNTDTDALDIPTLDAYNNLSPSYGSSSLAPSPLVISNPPNIAPSPYPYGTSSRISNPPANQPASAHIAPSGPQYGPTKPKRPSYSLQPAAAPGPKGFGPDFAMWCVARPTVPEPILQRAMDYACGTGASCGPIRLNGPCFVPNNLVAHASYAFNSYWQRTKIQGGTCDFGGTAMLITVDPSFRGCHFVYN